MCPAQVLQATYYLGDLVFWSELNLTVFYQSAVYMRYVGKEYVWKKYT